jgi:hypothetical protein
MGPEAQHRIRAAHSHLAEAMMGLYHEGVRNGEFREMPADLAGTFIQDTIMSAAKSVIAASDPQQRTPVVALHLRQFLLGGLHRDR